MNCNASLLVHFSDLCLSQPDNFSTECFPSEYYNLRIAVGVWSIISGFVGFAGNLLTIIAIPYAAKNNQYFVFIIINEIEVESNYYFCNCP